MTTRTLSTLLATAISTIPLLASADPNDAVFEACSHAFIASFTATHGPVAKIRVVPPKAKPFSYDRDPASGMFGAPLRYTLYATDPKTGTLLARAECTAKPKEGVTIARLPVPATDDKSLLLSYRETK